MNPTDKLSPKEILMSAVAAVYFGKNVAHKDIIKTLKGIIVELEEIQE